MKKKFNLIILLFLGFMLTSCGKGSMIEDISLSSEEIILNVGESKDLTASFTPKDAMNNVLTWTSEDVTIATVSNGKVIGVKYGETNIKVSDSTGKISKTCRVKVNVKDYTWDGKKIETKPESLKVNDAKESFEINNGIVVSAEVIEINTLEEFVYLFNKGNIEEIISSKAVIVRLMHDFYLGGYEWERGTLLKDQKDYNYAITIDGNGKMIYDFNFTGENASFLDISTEGYLKIKDLSFKKGIVIGNGTYAGVVNSSSFGNVYYEGITVEDTTIRGGTYVGAICAYSKASSFKKCTVKNVGISITPKDDEINVGSLSGLINAGEIEDCHFENVSITVSSSQLEEESQRIGILAGVIQSEVVLKDNITVKGCKIANIKVTENNKVIFLDNRSEKDYSKVTIS